MKVKIDVQSSALCVLLFSANAYAEEQENTVNLSGEWWGGRENEDLAYMKLVHEEGNVTGSLCERPDHDCLEIKTSVFHDNELALQCLKKH